MGCLRSAELLILDEYDHAPLSVSEVRYLLEVIDRGTFEVDVSRGSVVSHTAGQPEPVWVSSLAGICSRESQARVDLTLTLR